MVVGVDLHVHSDSSHDGIDSVMSLAEAAEARGLAAIAVCDHNLCRSLPETAPVLLIPGTEVSTASGHILGIFLDRPVDYEFLRADGLPSAKDAVAEIHAAGGLAVLAHPFERRGADRDTMMQLDVDLIETANSRDSMKVHDAGLLAERLADSMGKPRCGGSDAHDRRAVGACYTRVEIDSISLDELRAALVHGRCEAVRVRGTTWCEKARSQRAGARRSGSFARILRAGLYSLAAPIRDLLRI